MIDLLLPRTDAGVVAQAAVAALLFAVLLWAFRGDADLRLLIGGLALFTFAVLGLRAMH